MARIRTALLEDADEIALLASPTRIEIVDTLEALGDAVSVAELAAAVGRPADGLYYHLRQLAEGGLIEEEAASDGRRYRSRTRKGDRLRQLAEGGLIEEEAASDGRRYRSRTRKGDRLRLRYRPGATANADAVGRVAASVLRVAGRDFARALADPDTVVEGPRRELWAARGKGWVDAAELAEINRLLARLMELVQKPATERPRGKLVALSWVLAPVEAKPARRAAAPRKPRAR